MAGIPVRKSKGVLAQMLAEHLESAADLMAKVDQGTLPLAPGASRTPLDFKEHLLSIPKGSPDRLFDRKRTTSRRRTVV